MHRIRQRTGTVRDQRQIRQVANHYKSRRFLARPVRRSQHTKLAVVIHLYYPELWPLFLEKLKTLKGHPFDLFVTIPKHHLGFVATIQQTYPDVYVFEIPNHGRDVLPFMQVATVLVEAGYELLLKLHTKKSPHFEGGSDWLANIVSGLLPEDPALISLLIRTLSDKKTAVVGPAGEYLPLPVNFAANKVHLAAILAEAYSPADSERVIRHYMDYGFFAGTMFWARLDALRPILVACNSVQGFEPERGQIDGTLAHALERAFSVGPEIKGYAMYELSTKGLVQLKTYKTSNIPEWSDLYVPPAQKQASV